MPKIISDLKIMILSAAKEELFLHGYTTLTIRKIAKKCNIAVGTMYNYFPSKDMLVAEIILCDWNHCLTVMKEESEQASDIYSALIAIYDVLKKFRENYRCCWDQYATQANGSLVVKERHKMLSTQISSIVTSLLLRLQIKPDDYLAEFTAEMLLMLSNDDSFCFEQLKEICHRLYPSK